VPSAACVVVPISIVPISSLVLLYQLVLAVFIALCMTIDCPVLQSLHLHKCYLNFHTISSKALDIFMLKVAEILTWANH
jgi:hypothetical protein